MKYILLTIVLLLTNTCLKAQTAPNGAQGFTQPNISNTSTYGNIPVGLYTGVPNISIPIHDFQLKDIHLPVNLNYHAHNVKPNNLPCEVGLGWNLECGGFITRVIKNQPDRNYSEFPGPLYPYRVITTEQDLTQNAYIGILYPSSSPDCPDEFHFNFLGYSGSFVYNTEENKWMVQSDSDIKIEYNSITGKEARYQVSHPTRLYYDYLYSTDMTLDKDPLESNMFDSFTLTTPDGYKYIFGGTDKIDYNIPFKGFLLLPIPMTWHLSEIITPNGHNIEFKYQEMPFQINGNMSFNIATEALFKYAVVNYNYELIVPVQLSEVIDKTESKQLISLNYGPSTQHPYDSQYAWLTAMDKGLVTFFTQQKDFTLHQLNSLSVLERIKYEFSYTDQSNERLKLEKISRVSESGNKSTHYFNYYLQRLPGYCTGHYDNLGFYNGKDFSYYFSNDFFCNARDKDKQISEGLKYTKDRLGDASGKYATAEMLKTIFYPTGGYTEFIYEPNIISSMVSVDRKKLHPAHLPYPNTPDYTYPGGVRIKQIDNYNHSNDLLTRKHYYYTTDFSPEKRDGKSSGILSFTPQYLWGFELYNMLNASNQYNEYISYSAIISQSSNPLWYSSRGEFIGYSKVIECNEDSEGKLINGYTIHTFRNFEPGYMDEDPIVMLNHTYTNYPNGTPFTPTPYSPFTPCTSNALKRGVIISKEQFDNGTQIKQKELFEYTPIQKDSILATELTYTSVIDYNFENPTLGEKRHAFGGTYYIKYYSYPLSKKQTFQYDDHGNVISYTNKYEYDANKLIKRKTTEDENGNIYEEKTRYITDMLKYPDKAPYDIFHLMNRLHITAHPLEKTVIKNNEVISDETYFYEPDNKKKNIRKSSEYTLGKHVSANNYQGLHAKDTILVADPCNIKSISYLNYDFYNNPVNIYNAKEQMYTTYLYGYKGKYIVAEIKNLSSMIVYNFLGSAIINNLLKNDEPGYTAMKKINSLRGLAKDAFITTYEYIPNVGISQITDPKGVTTYFEYDDLGRLIHKKNMKHQLLNTYQYSKNL